MADAYKGRANHRIADFQAVTASGGGHQLPGGRGGPRRQEKSGFKSRRLQPPSEGSKVSRDRKPVDAGLPWGRQFQRRARRERDSEEVARFGNRLTFDELLDFAKASAHHRHHHGLGTIALDAERTTSSTSVSNTPLCFESSR